MADRFSAPAARLADLAARAAGVPGGHQLGELREPAAAARELRATADLVALAPVPLEGATVLDAGCGHGEVALALAVLGAGRVIAVDVGAEEVETVGRLRDELGGEAARLEPVRASVTDLPLPDASVDLVLSTETLGVVFDVGALIAECARVLRPGGAVVLAENNDVANPRLAARARRLWRAYELGPAGDHEGHAIAEPLVDQRARVARELLPGAPQGDVAAIAQRTFRHDRAMLEAACARYAETGELPGAPFDAGQAPVDLDGLRIEAPVEPSWMKAELRRHGLAPKVVGYWGGAGGSPLLRAADRVLRPLTPLTLRTARGVRYVGVRR